MRKDDKVFISDKTLNVILRSGKIKRVRTAIWIAVGSFLIPTTMLILGYLGIMQLKQPLVFYSVLGIISLFFFVRIFIFLYKLRLMLKIKIVKF